jgi:TolB-like protein/tetratricopeptide (TPR) repeat protein
MAIWTSEIKELETLYESFKGQFPNLEKELEQLTRFDDPNVILLYSRRCLEVIITDLCECELKRPRKTEPLKGIIDKLNKEEKVPPNIITSMHGLNDLSSYGTHPKDFDPEQVKPVLSNLAIIIKWYLKYKETGTDIKTEPAKEIRQEIKSPEAARKSILTPKKRSIGLVSALLLLLLTVVAVIFFNKEPEKSIAVLPFKNDSPDTTNIYFINGIMEDILNNLQRIKDMRVISRTSVEQYRKTTKSIPEIAKELGVNYLVEGSGQKSGNTINLSVQLLRAAKEGHLWGNSYEQEINNAKEIFDIQRQISEAIATELKAVITPQEKQIIDKIPTSDLAAYEDYLQGMSYFRKFTQHDSGVALQYFDQAIKKDPKFAIAYAGISSVWVQRMLYSFASPAEAVPKAMVAAAKALELDSTRAEVYLSLARIKTYMERNWNEAESSFKKCIELNPNNAEGHMGYSSLLTIVGRMKEAIEHAELAYKIDPVNPAAKAWYGLCLSFARRYDDAITIFQEVLKIQPDNGIAIGNIPEAFHQSGRYEEELKAWKLYFNSTFKDFVHVFDQGYAKAGYSGALNLEADTLVTQSKTNYIDPWEMACIYACAGNKERAMDMLESAYEVHSPNVSFILYPIYDFLRSEPRFQTLCKKLNLTYKLIE